uniref:Uncharacterized protein n=1 Tax=Phasianus colchicus TaxID=9054 RepID=A0A669QQQ0_PHACC
MLTGKHKLSLWHLQENSLFLLTTATFGFSFPWDRKSALGWGWPLPSHAWFHQACRDEVVTAWLSATRRHLFTAGQALAELITWTGGQVLLPSPFFCCFEVEDDSKPLLQPMAEDRLEKRSKQREEGSSWAVPEWYKGYEELLGGDTDPDFIEPVGIQKNVQALYYVLKHPLVYRDAKPRLDSMQKPYVPQKKVMSPSSEGREHFGGKNRN